MSAALDLVKSLVAAGVEFGTDGKYIRWRNSGGRMTPEVIATLATDKATVIDFLTRKTLSSEPATVIPFPRDLKLDPVARPDDAEVYLESLRAHGPATYGTMMRRLGWGGTRAGQAEAALKEAGRIAFDSAGRAYLVSEEGKDQ